MRFDGSLIELGLPVFEYSMARRSLIDGPWLVLFPKKFLSLDGVTISDFEDISLNRFAGAGGPRIWTPAGLAITLAGPLDLATVWATVFVFPHAFAVCCLTPPAICRERLFSLVLPGCSRS